MDIVKANLESQIGPISDVELKFAISKFEGNKHVAGNQKVFDETAYDILSTYIDYYRREETKK